LTPYLLARGEAHRSLCSAIRTPHACLATKRDDCSPSHHDDDALDAATALWKSAPGRGLVPSKRESTVRESNASIPTGVPSELEEDSNSASSTMGMLLFPDSSCRRVVAALQAGQPQPGWVNFLVRGKNSNFPEWVSRDAPALLVTAKSTSRQRGCYLCAKHIQRACPPIILHAAAGCCRLSNVRAWQAIPALRHGRGMRTAIARMRWPVAARWLGHQQKMATPLVRFDHDRFYDILAGEDERTRPAERRRST
jgi:hypothetical protein